MKSRLEIENRDIEKSTRNWISRNQFGIENRKVDLESKNRLEIENRDIEKSTRNRIPNNQFRIENRKVDLKINKSTPNRESRHRKIDSKSDIEKPILNRKSEGDFESKIEKST